MTGTSGLEPAQQPPSQFDGKPVSRESLRFHGGTGFCSGYLDVKRELAWAPICSHGFDSGAMDVLCRELDCGPPVYRSQSFISKEKPEVLQPFQQLQCFGNESVHQECEIMINTSCTAPAYLRCEPTKFRVVDGVNRCKGILQLKQDGEWRATEDVWRKLKAKDSEAICQNVRLSSGREACSGKLEVRSGLSWSPVCHSVFSKEEASVVCWELGCGFAETSVASDGVNHNQNWSPDFRCDGTENALDECRSCPMESTQQECQATYITCKERPARPRVTIQTTHESVEVSKFTSLRRGSRFMVSCSQNTPYAIHSFHLRPAVAQEQGPKWSEPAVDNTANFFFDTADETHQQRFTCDYTFAFRQDVFSEANSFSLSVQESSDLRLVDGNSRCAGQLELAQEREWMPVTYQHSWDVLPKPSITVRWSKASKNTLIAWGYSFRINCSVKTQFFGGHFVLVFSGLGQSHSHMKQAVNHSADFSFHSADFTHTGNYSCQYHNFVYDQNFTSESQALSITVKEEPEVFLDNGVPREDGSSSCAGLVQVLYDDEIRFLSAAPTVWDLAHASVVCRQLRCGPAISTREVQLQKKESDQQVTSKFLKLENRILSERKSTPPN
ncbi:scavenger receptor cysteine-rich type 1 protein M130-like [Neosynchiropus ocellatus]